jgi:hypothetical protein
MAREAGLVTKSNLILGMGETRRRSRQALRDLHAAGLRARHDHPVPAALPRHHPVERWVKPEEFVELKAKEAEEIGFAGVMSGSAGALQLPRRPAVRQGHPAPRAAAAGEPQAPRRGRHRRTGGIQPAQVTGTEPDGFATGLH